MSSFHPSFAQLLAATQAQMTFPSPHAVKAVEEEEKQLDTQFSHSHFPLLPVSQPLTAAPLPTMSATASSSPFSSQSSTFSSLPSLSSTVSGGSSGSCATLLLPHVQSLQSAFACYELQLRASLLSLEAQVERAGLDREAFERRWKREEVDYRRRLTHQLDDMRQEMQHSVDDLRSLYLHSHSQGKEEAPLPPAPTPPPSSASPPPLTAPLAALQDSLSAALAALHEEREERLRLSQRVAAVEAAARAVADRWEREEEESAAAHAKAAKAAEAERRAREKDAATLSARADEDRQATDALVKQLRRRLEAVEGGLAQLEAAVEERTEEGRKELRQHTTAMQQRLEAVEKAVSAASTREGTWEEAKQASVSRAPAARAPQPLWSSEVEASQQPSTDAATELPAPHSEEVAATAAPLVAFGPAPSLLHAAAALSAVQSASPSLAATTSASSSSTPYNLFIRLWNLPVDADGHNHPIAALFAPSAPSSTSSPSSSPSPPSSSSFNYVSQTDWQHDAVHPVFEQALLWDWSEGQDWLKLCVYDVESENVRDEDRLGSVLVPTAALRAAAQGDAAAAAALAASAGADVALLPPAGAGNPPSGLCFTLHHEDASKQALLSSVVLMVECEADVSTPRPPAPSAAPLRPALSLLVACTRLPCVPPAVPNPICAVFLQADSDGSWLYGGQSEWLKAEAAPVFEQGMSVEDDGGDEEGTRKVRLSVYDVETEEVRDEDRVGSVTLSMQQLRRAMESGEELRLQLQHEHAQQQEQLSAAHCQLLLQVVKAEEGEEEEEEMTPQLQTKVDEGRQEEPAHSAAQREVESQEADEDSYEVEAEQGQSSSSEEEEEEEAHGGAGGKRLPLLPRLSTADDADGGIELELSDEDEGDVGAAFSDADSADSPPSVSSPAHPPHRR